MCGGQRAREGELPAGQEKPAWAAHVQSGRFCNFLKLQKRGTAGRKYFFDTLKTAQPKRAAQSREREALAVQVLELEPSKVFLNIGTNNLGQNLDDQLWENYPAILQEIQMALPQCRIYLMAYYPCNNRDDFGLPPQIQADMFRFRTPARLLEANRQVEELAQRFHCRYIDVNRGLYDQSGLLQAAYATDGVHFYPDGYVPVLENLLPYLAE